MILPDVPTFARALGYVSALICIGAIPARVLLRSTWTGEGDAGARDAAQRRLTYLVFGAALLLPVAALVALRAQSVQLVDEGEQLGAAQVGWALSSGWGASWKAQAVAALVAVIAWFPRNGHPRFGTRLAPIAALALAATLPLTGHAKVVPTGPLLGVLNGTLHIVGAGLWLGTLAILTAVGWMGGEEGRASRVARLIGDYSRFALVGAALVALTGTIAGWQTVGSLGALTATPYGRTLLLKLGCLAGVAVLGAWNWRVVQPRLAAGTGHGLLRRSATVELLLGAVLLFVTALLVVLPAPGLE